MSSEVSLPIRTAQLLGITTSAIYSGSVFYQYFFLVPSYLSLPPKEAVSRWYRMHILSKNNLAPAALLGIFSYAFLALQHYTKPATYLSIGGTRLVKWKAYASATVLMMAFIPWTAKVMLPINYVLEDYHVGKKELPNREANALLGEWRAKSVARGFPVGAAALIGTLTVLA